MPSDVWTFPLRNISSKYSCEGGCSECVPVCQALRWAPAVSLWPGEEAARLLFTGWAQRQEAAYLSARVGTGTRPATWLPQLCALGEVGNLASLVQGVPDEFVEEHLSPGPLKSRFHYAAGATARSVARALGGLAQVAMRPLGFNLLSISRQRPGHGVLPHCPLRNSWTNRPCHPVSWYVMAPVSSLQRGLPAEWPARGGDTQIAATQRVGWLQGEGGWQVDVGVEGQWGPGTEYYAPHGGQAPTLPFSLPTTPGSSNASSLPA